MIREALRNSGMTARRLSEVAGVSEGRISDYLSGRHDPGTARLARLLEGTGHALAVVPMDRSFDRNGIVLAELLDLGDALAIGARPTGEREPLARFADLVAARG